MQLVAETHSSLYQGPRIYQPWALLPDYRFPVTSSRALREHPTRICTTYLRCQKGRKNPVIIANSEGQKPKNTVQQTHRFLVAEQWDSKTIYWTVELHDHRIIVKGGLGGRWWAWFGIGLGLTSKPVAFSIANSVGFKIAQTGPSLDIDRLSVDISDLGILNTETMVESDDHGLTDGLANVQQSGVYYDPLYWGPAKHLIR